jgi:general stress protein 26
MPSILAHERDRVPTGPQLARLYQLVSGIPMTTFTARRPDGRLVSRPLATQEPVRGADLWFVTDIESHDLAAVEEDPHVNLAYHRETTGDWISVSGTATVSQDRRAIRQLYRSSWKSWFAEREPPRDGAPDDPRIALILVDVHSVAYFEPGLPGPVVLLEREVDLALPAWPDIERTRDIDLGAGQYRRVSDG